MASHNKMQYNTVRKVEHQKTPRYQPYPSREVEPSRGQRHLASAYQPQQQSREHNQMDVPQRQDYGENSNRGLQNLDVDVNEIPTYVLHVFERNDIDELFNGPAY